MGRKYWKLAWGRNNKKEGILPAEVLQAGHAEQNIGTADEEEALRSRQQSNPKRPKAGR